MGTLANRDFVKMNGLGNEIVIVDLRRYEPLADRVRGRGARGGTAGAVRPAHGALSGARRQPTPWSASTTTTGRRQAPAATACAASPRSSARETGKAALSFETAAGVIACWRTAEGLFTVDMGAPRFRWDEIPLAKEMPDTRAIDLAIRTGRRADPALAVGREHGQPARDLLGRRCRGLRSAPDRPGTRTQPLFPERANITLAAVACA